MEIRKFEKYTAVDEQHEDYLRQLAAYAHSGPYRPNAHICPPCGLLNDPNGLCFFKGEYHVFYQWYPFGPSHGMKHWAHVKSRNLTDWKWCGEMLVPDREYEKNGCYSGNCYVNEAEGLCYLFYTANYKTDLGRVPKQAVAFMDRSGRIEKYGGNPIIDGAPEGMSGDIRDPFVFERDGLFYMLLGAADSEGKGQLLLYSSENLLDWSYCGVIRVPLPDQGTMVECPGLIEVDGKDVLFLSLIGLEPEKDRYHNQFSSLYLTGKLDIKGLEFKAEHCDEIDCGFDFYAPQAFYGKGREPLLFGWFGCGEQNLPEDEFQWRHGLTLARSLSVREGRLYQRLAGEAGARFETWTAGEAGEAGEEVRLTQPENPCRILLSVGAEEKLRTVRVGEEGDCWSFTIDMEKLQVTWDRSDLKKRVDPAYGLVRSASFLPCRRAEAEIYVDNSFVEIYFNGGERVFSGRAYL